MDILDLIDQLQNGGQDAADLIAVLGNLLREDSKSQFIRDSEHAIQTRILSEGITVTTDVNSVGRDVIGTSQFDTLNFISGGGVVRVNAANPRQADIPRGAGGGADCMFDYIVSACFLTLSGFSEGQVFTSLSGCTFKGYSNVLAMAAQAFIDFGTVVSVAYICGGTYLETNIVIDLNQKMRWVGAGRTRVIIGNTTNTSTDTVAMSTGSRLQTSGLTIRASTNGSATKGGVNLGGSSWLVAEDCVFRGRLLTTADTTTHGIIGGSSSQVYLVDCELQRNGFYPNSESVAQFVDCVHTGGGVGITCFNNTIVSGCFFNTSDVGVAQARADCQIVGNHFESAVIGITSKSAATARFTVEGNHFDNYTTAMDFSDGGTPANYGWLVTGNHGTNATSGTFVKWPSGTPTIQGIFAHNSTDGGGTFSSGTNPNLMRIGPNWEANGLARGDVIGTMAGVVQGSIETDFKSVRWGAFVVFFGSTKVTATPGSQAYVTNNTYYVSIAATGTVTANTTGAFPAGEFPLAIVTTNSVGTITGFEWYDGMLRTTSTGAAPAPADAPFVTYASTAALSANRVIAPISAYTPVGGVGFIDAGTDDGALTGTLKDLTDKWDQTGAFAIQQRGGDIIIANSKALKVYSDNLATPVALLGTLDATYGHMVLGSASAPDAHTVMSLNEIFIDPAASKLSQSSVTTLRLSASNSAGSMTGVTARVQVGGQSAGTFSITGPLIGLDASVLATNNNSAHITVATAYGLHTDAAANTNQTITDLRRIYVAEATGNGTVTTQYGLYIDALVKGATNYALYLLGGQNFIGGEIIHGPVSAPATPAAGNLVAYNLTGTQFLKVKDAAGLVTNLMAHRTIPFLIDGGGSAISTGIKGDLPIDFDCVIEQVTMLADQSGSVVVDIWKDTYANYPPTGADSITASAKPTITTATKSQDATLTGWTTTISAGDTLRYNVDSCSTITRVTVALKVRPV